MLIDCVSVLKSAVERGAKLTFTTFIAKAVVSALQKHPIINANDGQNVTYRGDINLTLLLR